jgi:hypothetical protein
MAGPTVHFVREKNGKLTPFTAVPVMTLDEMKEAGATKIADPNFIETKVAEALQKAKK